MPNSFNILPKWRYFGKSGHTGGLANSSHLAKLEIYFIHFLAETKNKKKRKLFIFFYNVLVSYGAICLSPTLTLSHTHSLTHPFFLLLLYVTHKLAHSKHSGLKKHEEIGPTTFFTLPT